MIYVSVLSGWSYSHTLSLALSHTMPLCRTLPHALLQTATHTAVHYAALPHCSTAAHCRTDTAHCHTATLCRTAALMPHTAVRTEKHSDLIV
jgi:hypothetical protein